MAASEHLNSNQLRTYWDKTGQGMLFSPRIGTGLATDPTSAARRLELVHEIIPRSFDLPSTDVARETIHRSNIPLQHLADLAHQSTRMHMIGAGIRDDIMSPSAIGQYFPHTKQIAIDEDYPDKRGASKTHELGHAMHHVVGGSKNLTESGAREHVVVREAIADGYSDRFHSRTHKLSRRGNYPLYLSVPDIGENDWHVYKEVRKHVRETGAIPHNSNNAIYDAFSKKQEQESEQLQLPGLEG